MHVENKRKKTEKNKEFKMLSLNEKLEIIQLVDKGEKVNNVANKFGVSRQAIEYVVRKKEVRARFQIMKDQHVNSRNPKLHGIEESKFEKCLFQWCHHRRERHEPISGPLIREKAQWFHKRLGCMTNFVASDGWLSKFKKRHGMRALKMKGEKLSSDSSTSEEFSAWLKNFIATNGYEWKNVYNGDETGLAWRAVPTNTLVMRTEKEAPGYKLPKDRLTIMVCTNATGTHKLKLLVIGKSPKPRCFKNVAELPVIYSAQKSAWMDREIFRSWFKNEFSPEVKKTATDDNAKNLLILDNAPSHPQIDELNSIDPNVQVVFLPPNVTALIQPMDQGVIGNLKKAYRHRFLQKVLRASENDSHMLAGFVKSWNLLECIHTLFSAWESISENSIKNAWKKIGSPINITNPESEVSELIQLAKDTSPSCTIFREQIEHWLKEDDVCPVFRMLTDEEIVANRENYNVLYEHESVDDSANDEEICVTDENKVTPSIKDATTACKTIFHWLINQNGCNINMFRHLNSLENFVTDVKNTFSAKC